MKRKIVLSSMLVLLVALAAVPAFARGGGPRGRPVVYVKSQGLFYDSIVTAMNLPANGPFQLFEMGGPSGFQTEFGPGDTGYGGGPLKRVTVYVRSTRLSYDSIVTTDLPQQGKFQELFPTMNGLETDFGPGDPGYLGGRWWVDENKNGVQDEGDSFFLCPLLGPGQ